MQARASGANYTFWDTIAHFPQLSIGGRNMRLRQKTFQSIAIDYQLTAVARDQTPALEHDQVFGDSWARCADQFREIPMTCGQRQPNSLRIGDAKIFSEFEQNQG